MSSSSFCVGNDSTTSCELKRAVPDSLDLPLEALLPGVELDDLDVVEDLVHRLVGHTHI